MLAAAAQLGGARPPAGLLPDSACAAARRFFPSGAQPVALDSVAFFVDGFPVSICYSRPLASPADPAIGSTRVPYGSVWRTGGASPAVLYTSTRVSIGGVVVAPGLYLLYTVPAANQWQVVINRTVGRWADGPGYDAALQGGEVGRAQVSAEGTRQYVQRFTLRALQADRNALLLLEWESVRVTIPIVPG